MEAKFKSLKAEHTKKEETFKSKEETLRHLQIQCREAEKEKGKLQQELNKARTENETVSQRANDNMLKYVQLQKDQEKGKRHFHEMKDQLESDIRSLLVQLSSLTKERDDIRDRCVIKLKLFDLMSLIVCLSAHLSILSFPSQITLVLTLISPRTYLVLTFHKCSPN